MGRKIARQILSVIFFSAISAFSSYLANSTLIFDELIKRGLIGENINIPIVQDYCLWIGVVFSALTLSLNLIVTKVKHDHILEKRNSLIKMIKNIMSSSLGKRFLSDSSTFDIRIFIPKYPVLYRIADNFGINLIRKKFIIKNIELIAEQGITKNLQFEVHPHQEGLVGICYNTKAMVYDDDLEHTNYKKYHLKQNQINRT